MKTTKKRAINILCDAQEYKQIEQAAKNDHRAVASFVKLAALREAKKND